MPIDIEEEIFNYLSKHLSLEKITTNDPEDNTFEICLLLSNPQYTEIKLGSIRLEY